MLDLFNSEATRPTKKPWKFDSLVDRRLIWRLAIPTPEDCEVRNGSEYRCSDYLDKLFSAIILSHLSDARLKSLVNDKYDLPFSI